jgi:hypothetical protein
MTIYNYIEVLFFILLFVEIGGKHSKAQRMNFFRLEAFIIFFILAFRNFTVGGDSPTYVWYFMKSPKYSFDEMPWGFELYCNILRFILNDWRFFMFVTSVIAVAPFLYLVKKYAKLVTLPFMTFLLCWNQLWLLETPMKQTTAIGFFFFGFLLLYNSKDKKRKILRYFWGIAMIAWSFLTHSTMILFAPLALALPFIKFSKKISIVIVLASVVVSSSIIIYIPDLFYGFTDYAAAFSVFDNIGNNYIEDINTGLETLNLNAILPQSLYVIFFILLCSYKDLQTYPAKCLIVAPIMLNLVVSFPNSPRVILYFSLIGSALCPEGIFDTLKKGKGKVLFLGLVLLMIAFFYIHLMTCINFKPAAGQWSSLPYSTWFFSPVAP